jgi:hypothetical protein
MKRWLRGSVVLATAVGMWSCSGDPTDSFRGGPSRIVATPASLFITEGQTEAVIVQAQDDQGNPLAVTFDTTVGAGISVIEDVTFLPTNGAPIQGQTRYLITANTFLATSFTVRAEGDSLVIPVRGLPATFAGTFSNVAPALGDTVTLTAPAGLRFGPETFITFAGAAGDPVITGISADSTVLSFLPAPSTDTVASVAGLQPTYAPGVTLDTLETTTKLTTTLVADVPAVFSDPTPAQNQLVTVSAPGFKFLPSAGALFGADTAVVFSVAADSSSMTFVAKPGATGIPAPELFGIVLSVLPQVPLKLPTTTNLAYPALAPVGGTDAAGTAPSLDAPATGFSNRFYDQADFTAAADRFYKLVVTEDGVYDISFDWTTGSDIDLFVCPAPGAITASCDFQAAVANHPEAGTYTLTAGTWYIVGEDFGGDAGLSAVTITVAHPVPEE